MNNVTQLTACIDAMESMRHDDAMSIYNWINVMRKEVHDLELALVAMGMGDFAESALQNLCNGEEVGNDGDR